MARLSHTEQEIQLNILNKIFSIVRARLHISSKYFTALIHTQLQHTINYIDVKQLRHIGF